MENTGAIGRNFNPAAAAVGWYFYL